MTVKLVIDSDGVSDDIRAISLALQHPKVEVIAITAVHGCVTVDQAYANIKRTIRANGKESANIPVYKGAQKSILSLPKDETVSDFFGIDGIGDQPKKFPEVIESDFKYSGKHAALALIDTFKQNPDATLVTIGPLTNIAIALQLDESFATSPSRMIIMGGNYYAVGNVDGGSSAEYNFHGDPEAASIVLRRMRCPITIVPWEAFHFESELHDKSVDFSAHLRYDTPLAGYLSLVTSIGREKCEKNGRQYSYCDEIAVATAIDEHRIAKESKELSVDVELTGNKTRKSRKCQKFTQSAIPQRAPSLQRKIDEYSTFRGLSAPRESVQQQQKEVEDEKFGNLNLSNSNSNLIPSSTPSFETHSFQKSSAPYIENSSVISSTAPQTNSHLNSKDNTTDSLINAPVDSSNQLDIEVNVADIQCGGLMFLLLQVTGSEEILTALVDTGANHSLIAEAVIQRLHLAPRENLMVQVNGINGKQIHHSGINDLQVVTSETPSRKISLLSVPSLPTKFQAPNFLDKMPQTVSAPTTQFLALASKRDGEAVDLLIGIELYWEILSQAEIQDLTPNFKLLKTKFGPIFANHISFDSNGCDVYPAFIAPDADYEYISKLDVQQLWDLDKIGITPVVESNAKDQEIAESKITMTKHIHNRGQVVVDWLEQLWKNQEKETDHRRVKFVTSYNVEIVDSWMHAVTSGSGNFQ